MNMQTGAYHVVHLIAGHRVMLNLTLIFDHDLADGAPATRFASVDFRSFLKLRKSGTQIQKGGSLT